MQLWLIWTTFGVWIWISYSNQLQLTCCKLNVDHISTMPVAFSYMAYLNNIWSLNLNFLFKSTSINMWQIELRAHQYHAMIRFLNVHCSVMFILCCLGVCFFSIDPSLDVVPVFSEEWHPPSLDNKASKPPLIISIKTQFPSCSLMHWLGDSHVTVLPLDEPILCMIYHCYHSIKQIST